MHPAVTYPSCQPNQKYKQNKKNTIRVQQIQAKEAQYFGSMNGIYIPKKKKKELASGKQSDEKENTVKQI